jgi:HSP20 family protein
LSTRPDDRRRAQAGGGRKGQEVHRIERQYGQFIRRFALPADVDGARVKAEFKDGVLNVQLPKAPNAKPKAVDIKVA